MWTITKPWTALWSGPETRRWACSGPQFPHVHQGCLTSGPLRQPSSCWALPRSPAPGQQSQSLVTGSAVNSSEATNEISAEISHLKSSKHTTSFLQTTVKSTRGFPWTWPKKPLMRLWIKLTHRKTWEGQPEVSLHAPSSPSGKARLPRPPAVGLLPHQPLRDREGALWTPHVLAVTPHPSHTLSCAVSVESSPLYKYFSGPFQAFTTTIWRTQYDVLKFGCVCSLAKPCLTLWSHGLNPATLLCPWDFPSKNNGVGCHFLFREVFLTQGLNPSLLGLLHWQVVLYHSATREALKLE